MGRSQATRKHWKGCNGLAQETSYRAFCQSRRSFRFLPARGTLCPALRQNLDKNSLGPSLGQGRV